MTASQLPKLDMTLVQTSPAAGTAVAVGATVTYTLTIDADPAATAGSLANVLSVDLGNDLTLVAGSISVKDPSNIGHDAPVVAADGGSFTLGIPNTIPVSAQPITITFDATVAATATNNEVLTPSADITYQNASPDELIYATANNDGGGSPFFYQYDYTTNTVTRFGTPSAPQDSLAFLGNGEVVATFKAYNGNPDGIGLYNLTTGKTTMLVTGIQNGGLDLAVSIDSKQIYFTDEDSSGHPNLRMYDLTTSKVSTIWQSSNNNGYTGITFTPDGKLYACYGDDPGNNATNGQSWVVEINPSNGHIIRQNASTTNGSNLDALRYDPFTGHLFVGNHNGGSNNVYEIDPATLNTVHSYTVGTINTVDGKNVTGNIDGLSADGKGRLFVTSIDNAITVLDVNPKSATYGQELTAVYTPSVDDTVPVSAHDNFNTKAGTTTTVQAAGSLSGHVFLDQNADGVKGSGDTYINHVSVQLLDGSGNAIAGQTATTDANGYYQFTGLAAGNYAVRVTAPAGDSFSPIGTSADKTVDSIVNAGGQTTPVAVKANQDTADQNAGVYAPGGISGRVFFDNNGNGVKDGADIYQSGVKVQLLDASGTPTGATATTNGSGAYTFTGLTPGSYGVKFTAPSGDSFSPVGTNTDPTLDSFVDKTGEIDNITVTSGATTPNENAGLVTAKALLPKLDVSIAHDAANNCDGGPGTVNDFHITVKPNATATDGASQVHLVLTMPADLPLNHGSVVVTDPNGGTWKITETATGFTADLTGTFDLTDQPVTFAFKATVGAGATANETLTPSVNVLYQGATTDEIVYATDNVNSDFYQYDVTTNTITTFGKPTGHMDSLVFAPDGDLIYTQQNGASGLTKYNLTTGVSTTLVPGQGTGDLVLSPDGTKVYFNGQSGGLGTLHVYDLVHSTDTVIHTYASGERLNGLAFDNSTGKLYAAYGSVSGAGYYSSSPGRLAEIDPTNGNVLSFSASLGEVDGAAWDPKTGHIFVTGNGNPNLTELNTKLEVVHTWNINAPQGLDGISADGQGNLFIANYHNSITKVDLTKVVAGSIAQSNSMVTDLASAPNIDDTVPQLYTPTFNSTASVGTVVCGGTLSGHLFLDQNGDGVQQAGTDANLSGYTVQLLDGAGNPTGITTTTDGNGAYQFTNLNPGQNYAVKFIAPTGDVFSPVGTNLNPALDSIVDASGQTAPVTAVSEKDIPNQNAGVYAPVSYSGHVFADLNADGVQQLPGDTAIGGVAVQLLDGNGNLIAGKTTTTNAKDGSYTFSNLAPGSYQAKVVPPAATPNVSPVGTNSDPSVDSVANGSGVTPLATLASGQSAINENAGLYAPGTLSGRAFFDNNGDGVLNGTDSNLSGVTVQLLDGKGTPTGKTTTTRPDGTYSFTGLTPGQYEVHFVPPPGDSFSPVGTNVNPALDSIVDRSGFTAPVTIASGQTVGNQNAGLKAAVPLLPKLDVALSHDAANNCDGGPGTVNHFHITVAPNAGATDGATSVHLSLTIPAGLTLNAGSEVVTDSSGQSWTIHETATGFTADLVGTMAVGAAPVTISFTATTAAGVTANQSIDPSVNVTYQGASPDEIVYATNLGANSIYQFDVTTGTVTTITGLAETQDSLTFSPDGYIYYTGSTGGRTTIHKLDLVTKTDTTLYSSKAAGFSFVGDLTLAPDGHTLVVSGADDKLYTFDTQTSTLKVLADFGPLPSGVEPSGVTFDPAGNLYVNIQPQSSAGSASGSSYILKLNFSTGAIIDDSRTQNATLGKGQSFDALTYDAYTGHLFTANRYGGGVWEIDQKTWTVLNKYDTSVNMDGVSSDGRGKIFVEDVLHSFHVVDLTKGGLVTLVIPAPNIDDTVPAQVNPTFVSSASVHTVVCGGTLSGHLFLDQNGDGVQQAGTDANLSGYTVQLLDAAGNPTGITTTTDGNGAYQFANLNPGQNYAVKFIAPTGDVFSPVGTNVDPALDSIVDASGQTAPVTAVSEKDIPNQNAGVYAPVTVSGHVFLDQNDDGVQQLPGDTNLQGISVQLLDASGLAIAGKTTTTNGSGFYQFAGLAPGQYAVKVTAPAAEPNFSPVGTNVDPALDSIVNPATGITPTTVFLTSGQSAPNQNAGLWAPGSLSGHVFLDQNGNGVQQLPGDANQPGLTVQLLDGSGNPVLVGGKPVTTITGADGGYQFKGLTPGFYEVKVVPPAGNLFSPPGASLDKTVDSVVNGQGITPAAQVLSGTDTPNQNAADYAPVTVSGHVFTDYNDDGVQNGPDTVKPGVTVQLLNSAGTPIAGKTAITGDDGGYSFTGLAPGQYAVHIVTPAGDFVPPVGHDPNPALNSIDNAQGITPTTPFLTSGQSATNQNGGLSGPGSLSGHVFLDTNGDGVQEAGETDVTDVTVQLLDSSGNPVLVAGSPVTTTTDGAGHYQFKGLVPGQYEVKVVPPAGDAFSPVGHDPNPALDSIVNGAGITPPAQVLAFADTPNQNAGVYVPGHVKGKVFLDTDPGLCADKVAAAVFKDVTVNLVDSHGTVVGHATTDGSGNYQIDGVAPGSYQVQVVVPAGLGFGPLGAGAFDNGSMVDPATGLTGSFTVLSGQTIGQEDAGLHYVTGTIADGMATMPGGGYSFGSAVAVQFQGSANVNLNAPGNVVVGGDGGLSANANAGGSQLIAGTGFATLNGGPNGGAVLVGGQGGANIEGTSGNDIIVGGCGAISAQGLGSNAAQNLAASAGFLANLGGDLMLGGKGNDTLEFNQSSGTVSGGAGDDYIHAAGNGVILAGGTNSGTIAWDGSQFSGFRIGDTVNGSGAGDDWIYQAGDGVQWIENYNPNAGDHIDVWGFAAPTATGMVNGYGVLYFGANQALVFNSWQPQNGTLTGIVYHPESSVAPGAIDQISPQVPVVLGASVTSFYGTQGDDIAVGSDAATTFYGKGGNDYLVGGAGGDTFYGNGGNNDLHGGGGNDSFYVGVAGNNVIDGGTGTNTVYYGIAHTAATVTHLASGAWELASGNGVDLLSNIQNIQFSDGVLTLPANSFAPSGGSVPLPSLAGDPDFNGDGYGDLLFRHTDGTTYAWEMKGSTVIAQGVIGAVSNDWQITGIGDFNGDGRSDILWHNASIGTYYLWSMDGLTIAGGGAVQDPGGSWAVTAIADFDGDGKSDLLWQNAGGDVYLWKMSGNAIVSGASLGNVGTDWAFRGAADLDGDGRSDILWQNKSTGLVYAWEIDGGAIKAQGTVGGDGTLGTWGIVGEGDFNGDGRADILWQNQNDGSLYEWQMDGLKITGQATIATPGKGWTVSLIEDLDGDHKADIVLTNAAGDLELLTANGLAALTPTSLGSVGTAWHLV